ncbi:hypothetical protein SDC9_178762 [bioreactor metagenome]|uniref:Uncharacterized protein n=1 Tax=bioreactor metagenome TaxID=1076179 RepID=A0A645GX33_9ZZZZ
MVVAQHGLAGRAGQVQVTRLHQADVRTVVLHLQEPADVAQKFDAELRDGDVDRAGELLPDRTGRQR